MTTGGPDNAASAAFRAVLNRSGPIGRLITEHDWDDHQLGPVSGWPAPLRNALAICVSSRFPIVIFWGPEFRLLYNDAYVPMLGDKHPRSLGQGGQECWGEIWPVIGSMLTGVLQRGEATWSEDLLLRVNRHGFEEEAYFTFSYSPIHDDAGRVGGVFCAVAESTAQVLGERRWRLLRNVTQAMLGSRSATDALVAALTVLPDDPGDLPGHAVYVNDGSGPLRPVTGNRAAADGLEPQPSALAPEIPSDLLLTGASAAAQVVATLPWIRHDATEPVRYRTLIAPLGTVEPGSTALIALAYSPCLVADDTYAGFLGQLTGLIAAGIADARAVEAQRERAEALAALDRSKSVFFANMSHEFRTPLTLMLGPLEDALAETGPGRLDAAQRDWVELVHRNGQRLLKLVNALLDFARAESGQLRAQPRPHDLAALTRDLASMFRSAVEKGGVTLTVDCPPLPVAVAVDQDMWEQIVTNLVSNAYKHTFHGEITVSLRADNGQACLTVRDSGSGIPEDELPHLFDRFHRIEGAAARSHEGSGIGLSLVRELVALHGGTIEVASKLGRGSTFTVRIPLAPEAAAHPASAPQPSGRAERLGALVAEMQGWSAVPTRATAPRTAGGDGGSVLIVDDNPDMRGYLTRIVGQRYRVIAVADAASALDVTRAERPDLIVSDVMMPGISGLEFVEIVRGDPMLADIPVILLSARAGAESAVDGLAAGADDYLIKPFSAAELLGRISARISTGSSRHHDRVMAELATALLDIGTPEAITDALHQQLASLFDNDHTQLAVRGGEADLRVWGAPVLPGGIAERYRTLSADAPVPIAAAAGDSRRIVIPDLSSAAENFPAAVNDLVAAGIQATVTVGLPGEGAGPVGTLTLSWRVPHAMSPDQLELLDSLAGVAAQTVARLQRVEHDRRISGQVQQRLLHIGSRSATTVVAARYQPADPAMVVGGDWYDCFVLPDGRVGATIGDVVGNGLDAAIVMGQLRSALGACAAGGADPHVVLDTVDFYTGHIDGAFCTTVAYLVLDPDARVISWCCAGHPPPLIVENDSADLLWEGRRRPLGVPADSPVSSARHRLAPGSLVLLYTDGLVERHGEPLDQSLERLRLLTGAHAHLSAGELCDTLIERMAPAGGYTDDVAVIALRLTGSSPTRHADVGPASPDDLSAVRGRLRDWLATTALPADRAEEVIIAVGEALDNAFEHGSPRGSGSPVSVEVSLTDALVRVTISDTGSWGRDSSASARHGRGRGFMLMRNLADDVSIRQSPLGTAVTLVWDRGRWP